MVSGGKLSNVDVAEDSSVSHINIDKSARTIRRDRSPPVHVADGFTDRGIGYHSKFIRKSKKAECLGLVDARIPELRANADGIFKIGRKLGIGTSVVQRVSSSVELEVQNPDEFRKEFSAV